MSDQIRNSNLIFVSHRFQGPKTRELRDVLEVGFKKIKYIKPEATRTASSELFLICKNYRPMEDETTQEEHIPKGHGGKRRMKPDEDGESI